MTTYQERFTEARKTTDFANHNKMVGGYVVWDVQHTRDGQKVVIDGPFFTEDEAQVSADLLRDTFRGARAHQAIHCSAWNPNPLREKAIRDDAMASRMILAMQLRVDVPTDSATGALE